MCSSVWINQINLEFGNSFHSVINLLIPVSWMDGWMDMNNFINCVKVALPFDLLMISPSPYSRCMHAAKAVRHHDARQGHRNPAAVERGRGNPVSEGDACSSVVLDIFFFQFVYFFYFFYNLMIFFFVSFRIEAIQLSARVPGEVRCLPGIQRRYVRAILVSMSLPARGV